MSLSNDDSAERSSQKNAIGDLHCFICLYLLTLTNMFENIARKIVHKYGREYRERRNIYFSMNTVPSVDLKVKRIGFLWCISLVPLHL